MKKHLIIAFLALALVGCGSPAKDASDFDSHLEELMAEPYTADQE